MLVNRQELLQKLEIVAPGLARQKETVEQSSCFIFKRNSLITYNGDLMVRTKCPAGWEGAVGAEKLLTMLQKLAEDDLDITLGKGELLIKGMGRKAGVRMEADITLPMEAVEKPGAWQDLPEGWLDAIDICIQCTTKDDSQGFYKACIHVAPAYIEACDNYQMARYPLVTGVASSTLIKRESIKHVMKLSATHLAETEGWLHFAGAGSTVLSCRKSLAEAKDFPTLDEVLKCRGTPATLPGGLPEAADKAAVFSADNAELDNVTIELRTGGLRITGKSAGGWYQEQKKIKYDGPPLVFQIAPKLLTEIAKRHNECEISPTRLRVDGGKWVYLTCLGAADNGQPQEVAVD